MGLRLIRQESETPNVSNHDDARMARYAYGGYDGYVKNRGQEIGHTISGTSFVVQSGVLNLQGWEVEIDANGVSIPTSASVTNKTYFSVYLEVNCATDTAEIKSLTDTAGFPDVPASDDLTENTIGTARLLLYHFTATGGVIADVEKLVQEIPYGADALNAAQSENEQKFSEIEQRLDELGFSEASIENGEIALQSGWSDAESPKCTVQRLGKFAILKELSLGTKTNITSDSDAYYKGPISGGNFFNFTEITAVKGVLAIIPEGFRPKEDILAIATISKSALSKFNVGENEYWIGIDSFQVSLRISKTGEITATDDGSWKRALEDYGDGDVGYVNALNIGWELP